jgi:hypothetical protein
MRSMEKPGTDFGRPASSAAVRPRVGRQRRVAAHQLADAAHDEVVGARLDVHALRSGLAERGADAVDEDDLTGRTSHGALQGSGRAPA